jgi:hypothetical protein
MLLRSTCVALALIGCLTLGIMGTGCQPPSETSQKRGATDTTGYALVAAHASGGNHHWNVELSLRAAPAGTYALLFSSTPPTHRGWFAISPDDPAIRCAAAVARGCTLADHGDVVSVARIGPGGAGVLRASFDVGPGGWFSLVRIEGPSASARFDVQIVSEALTKEEEPHRFAIEQVQ